MWEMRKARGGRRTPDRPEGPSDRAIHTEDVLHAQQLLDEFDHEGLAELFDVLAEPTRLRIVHILLRQEMCTSDLAAALELSDPAVSQHLRILRNLRIATTRRAGRIVYYSVASRAVDRLLTHGQRALGADLVDRRRTEHEARAPRRRLA
jgi:ArsR family transcriptional regulator, lead/cadmium/zinc/bismuth-responsive transcriptional repressor